MLVEQEFKNNNELIKRFPKAFSAINQNTPSLITYVQDRPGHDRRNAIDAIKTNHELGYGPKESFSTGKAKTVQWYLNNDSWW